MWREFNNRTRYCLFGDNFLIVITVSLDNYWIIVRRKLMLVTIRT